MVRRPLRTPARQYQQRHVVPTGLLAVAIALASTFGHAHEEPANATVATIGARKVTRAELEGRVRGQMVEIETQRYELLSEGLDTLIDEILIEQEAAARKMTTDALIEAEVRDKIRAMNESDPIDEAAVQKFYDQYKDQLGNQPLDTVRPGIVNYLQQQRQGAVEAVFVRSLRDKTKVAILLQPPRVEVSAEGPSRGPADAPIIIVEFSDFECPFCQRAAAVVEQVMEQYKGKARLVYRHYPLPNHSNAQRAAEAATCANEQGKFWPYHDLLFRNQRALSTDDLNQYARDVELDETKFAACMDSGRAAKVVEKDIADGDAAGVNGTPAFFINGRPLSGAQPFESFSEAIDQELARRSPRAAVGGPPAGSPAGM
jgi:protein-disulfide isomerase